MTHTKELHVHTNRIKVRITKCFTLLSCCIIWCLIFSSVCFANAATLKIHNYVTNDSYDYTGVTVTYFVNGNKVDSEYPGIILSNGGAVGPLSEVFLSALGATTDYRDGEREFTVSYGDISVKMTLGNTEAFVNGKRKIMTNAPFVYSFQSSEKKHLYVPTRFLAETFGFVYTWDSKSSTASIQRPNCVLDGKEKITYTGTNPRFFLNDVLMVSDLYPGYVFDDIVYFSAEDYFKNSGMASYAYAEGSGLIILKKDNITVRLVLDSPVAYINEDAYLLGSVPRLITPEGTSKGKVYIPAEFVAKALGYNVVYQKSEGLFYVSGKLPSTENETPKNGSGEIIPDTASYGEVIFSYNSTDQLVEHFFEDGVQIPKMIAAYSCMHSDAIYLKGISATSIKITDKTDVIEIEVVDYYNPFKGKACYNPNGSFLNYCYFSGNNSLKITIIKTQDLEYYTYSAPDGCVIHFTDTLGLYEDALKFTEDSAPETAEEGITDIFGENDMEAFLPDAVFSRNQFVIPLPENIEQRAITDTDEYLKNRFTISIPGNHMAFLSEQDTYNPIATLKNVQFSYKSADNTTIITFNTTKIQGYSITVAGGFLGVEIADPKEIYDKIIVLDAGHGGVDPGTLRNKVYEKDVNFNVINKYAAEYFEDSDIKVYYTRTSDTKIALETRAAFAASVDADLFISFHVNANSSSSVKGTSVYYSASNNKANAAGLKSSVLATSVVNHLSEAWNTKNRGILTDKFVVVHKNTVPAVLVECGFITNDSDFEKIKDATYQKKAAKALFDAVTEIFEQYPTGR